MKKLIAANWKMNSSVSEGAELVATLSPNNNAEVVICPPFTLIAPLTEQIRKAGFGLGAQDCHHQEKGAFTGDVSAPMLKELGCTYVIVGHSERRLYHSESSDLVAKKATAAAKNELTPIICVGESLDEREAGKHLDIVAEQLSLSLPDIRSAVIAYEPIWAIGTGKVASTQDIKAMHAFLSQKLKQAFSNGSFRVIYGGSVNDSNAAEILSTEGVDGALVGGASLKAESFMKIISAV